MDKIHLGKSERKNSVFCSLRSKNSLCYYPSPSHTNTERGETEIRMLKCTTQGLVNKIQWFVCASARARCPHGAKLCCAFF